MLELSEKPAATLAEVAGLGEQEALRSCLGLNPSLLSLTMVTLMRPPRDC
jgi:hypothetical protein